MPRSVSVGGSWALTHCCTVKTAMTRCVAAPPHIALVLTTLADPTERQGKLLTAILFELSTARALFIQISP